jgi:hypothetical protein
MQTLAQDQQDDMSYSGTNGFPDDTNTAYMELR